MSSRSAPFDQSSPPAPYSPPSHRHRFAVLIAAVFAVVDRRVTSFLRWIGLRFQVGRAKKVVHFSVNLVVK